MTGKVVEALAKILEGLNKNSSLEEVSIQLKKQKEFDQFILRMMQRSRRDSSTGK